MYKQIKLMKKLSVMMMIALAACMFQACSGNKDGTETADSINAERDSADAVEAGVAADEGDAKFAVDAANGGMAEVALGKLAQGKATNAKVKEFAAMMVADHSKTNDELMALAKNKNITLPDSVSTEKKNIMDDLSKKSGKDFDKAYVDQMIDDHKKTISLFEDASKNAKDADIKAFVDKALPTVKAHLEHVTAIHDGMK
jgi:putative membrane protein